MNGFAKTETFDDYKFVQLSIFAKEGVRTLYLDINLMQLSASIGDENISVWDFHDLMKNATLSEIQTNVKEYPFQHNHSYNSCGESTVIHCAHEILLFYKGSTTLFLADTSVFKQQSEGIEAKPVYDNISQDATEIKDEKCALEPLQEKFTYSIPLNSFPVALDKSHLLIAEHVNSTSWLLKLIDFKSFKDNSRNDSAESNLIRAQSVSLNKNKFFAFFNGFRISNILLGKDFISVVIDNSLLRLYSVKDMQVVSSLTLTGIELVSLVSDEFIVALCRNRVIKIISVAKITYKMNIISLIYLQKEKCYFDLGLPYCIDSYLQVNPTNQEKTLYVVYNDDTGVHICSKKLC